MKKIILIVAFILLAITSNIYSEDFQSKGREFFLTFMPNYHNNFNNANDAARLGDSLYIFIAADDTCSGTITGKSRLGMTITQNFKLTDVNKIYTFKVSHYDFELWGYNLSGTISGARYQSEVICDLSFKVVSTADVTVYAHSQAVTTSDAFIVFPTSVLGTKYIVMAYNSDGYVNGSSITTSSTPSQFAIVSTEDDNVITIKPKQPTRYNATYTQKITLNKGQVYLVQANISKDTLQADLTGTEIESTKKIAVFGGQQRARVPSKEDQASSRDFLCEQLIPVINWGKNAFVVPFAQDPTAIKLWNDQYRILAAYDSTKIKIGNDEIMLNANQYYDNDLTSPLTITADNKILVAQFKKTANNSGSSTSGSDPFMILVPPKEQFLKKCRVINAQAYELIDFNYQKAYFTQYVTVVLPKTSISSLKIDNSTVTNAFTDIPLSNYSYANIQVSDGVHLIECNEPFEVYVYGYGAANSYGYLGGMSFIPITFDLPQFSSNINCGKLTGYVSVEANKDIQLTEVNLSNETNTKTNISDSTSKIKKFTSELVNRYLDGTVTIKALDSKARTENKTFDIPGFTLRFPGGNNSTLLNFSNSVEIDKDYKFVIPIQNIGKFTQKINSLKRKTFDTRLIASYIVQRDILPGAQDTLVINFKTSKAEPLSEEITLYNSCGDSIKVIIDFTTSKCGASAFEYQNFLSEAKIYKTGYTYRSNDRIRLTSSNQNVRGAFWRAEKMPIGKSFSTDFSFVFSDGSNKSCKDNSLAGADGIAFVIQNNSLNSLGLAGGGIGYAEIPNAIAIEFDTFNNDSTQIEDFKDPNGNHIALMTNSIAPISPIHLPGNTIKMNSNIPAIVQNQKYYSKIDYNYDLKELKVYLDTTMNFKNPVLEVNNFDISKTINLDNNLLAYIGFTSATGCAAEIHDILSWNFCGSASITDVEDNRNNELSAIVIDNYLQVCCINQTINEIRIYDLQGSLISNFEFSELDNKLLIPINNLMNGVYFVEIKAEQNIYKKVFLKY